jgi:hypothetical protein
MHEWLGTAVTRTEASFRLNVGLASYVHVERAKKKQQGSVIIVYAFIKQTVRDLKAMEREGLLASAVASVSLEVRRHL